MAASNAASFVSNKFSFLPSWRIVHPPLLLTMSYAASPICRPFNVCLFLAKDPDRTSSYPIAVLFRDCHSKACPFEHPIPNPCVHEDHPSGFLLTCSAFLGRCPAHLRSRPARTTYIRAAGDGPVPDDVTRHTVLPTSS